MAMMAHLDQLTDQNLGKLPSGVYVSIRDHLDVSPPQRRALLSVLDGPFTMDTSAQPRNATSLLKTLSDRNMTISQFVHFAALAEDTVLLKLFGQTVPVTVRECSPPSVMVFEGDPLSIGVRASGQPLYQWFKDDYPLQEANQSTYYVPSAGGEDAGMYHCEVFDGNVMVCRTPVTIVSVYRPAPLEISVQPRAQRVELCGAAVFRCEVLTNEGVSYQWYRNDEMLRDSTHVQGTTRSKLRLDHIDSVHWQGSYSCVVSKGTQRVFSHGAPLQVVSFGPEDEKNLNYTATDKVALLIGCGDYRGTQCLKAPRFDVQTLVKSFRLLGFTVVSLLDVTRQELIAVVHEFQKLIGEGVYCVFYFCGHGFERFSKGLESHCFLVPVDAPVAYSEEHCVAAQMVFSLLLEKNPAICCMILDICRRNNAGTTQLKWESEASQMDDDNPSMDFPDRTGAGKSIVCYGTCYGMAAYEDTTYGIFVHHLKNFLHEHISMEEVFTKLREALGRDKRVQNSKRCQIAEMKSNLIEPKRSFADPIVFSGFTSQFNRSREIWERAHTKPEPRDLELQFPGFEVRVRLTFQQEYSNVLKIYVSTVEPGLAQRCVAFVSGVPAWIAEKGITKAAPSLPNNRTVTTYVSLKNIQRLKDKLLIHVTAQCYMADGSCLKVTEENIDLQFPLVASLQLWRGHRVAAEQEEI